MSRPGHSFATPALLVLLTAACGEGETTTSEVVPIATTKPTPSSIARGANVLLITVDTLRADHLGTYGYPRDTTPTIDQFAEEAVVFEQAIVQWPKTNPSMTSMFTSTYGRSNGVRTMRSRIPAELTTFAEVLDKAGYTSGSAVSNPGLSQECGFDRGFDDYLIVWEDSYRTTGHSDWGTEVALEVADQALDGNTPYFLWMHYMDPHAPYVPDPEHDKRFVGDAFDTQNETLEFLEKGARGTGGIPDNVRVGRENRVGYYIAQYDACIRTNDDAIRDLLAGLESRGMLDNTIVVISADHGEALGFPNGYFGHGKFPYDDCAHVPLIIKLPNNLADPYRVPEVVGLIDLMPTLVDVLGLEQPDSWMGRSFLPALLNQERSGEPSVVMESGFAVEDFQTSVRGNDYKLIHIPTKRERQWMTGEEWEFYDMRNDPDELNNLVDLDHPQRASLEAALSGYRDAVPYAPRVEQAATTAESREQLIKLGYVEETEDG